MSVFDPGQLGRLFSTSRLSGVFNARKSAQNAAQGRFSEGGLVSVAGGKNG